MTLQAYWNPAVFLLCAATLAACGRESPGRAPNILLISFDSVRRDLVSAYGYRSAFAPEANSSPTLERLAAEGVLFERAYSTTSWTLPAHASLMTGKPDLVHGVEVDALSIAPTHPTLAELLAQAGYRTAGFYSGPYLDPRFGFGRGFARYSACYGEELAQATARARALEHDPSPEAQSARAEAQAAVERLSHRDQSSTRVSDLVLAELRQAEEESRPWFIFAHYFDPHYDFVPPAPYNERFDPQYAGTEQGQDLLTSPTISLSKPTTEDPRRRERVVAERELEHIRALYAGELAWTDAQLGRVIEHLRASGELEDTIVLFVADHGDEFFEHGNLGHRKGIYEEVIQIPMLMRYPAALPQGKRVNALASIYDLYATALELADLPAPQGMLSRSLVPLARARETGAERYCLGRNVNFLPLPHKSGAIALDTWIEEYYLEWPIKVRRTRRWIGAGPRTPAAQAAEFEKLGQSMRSKDHLLQWIDLEKHPGEELAAYQSDFRDARAQAVLGRYRKTYLELLEQRQPAAAAGRAATEESLLAGLGYAGEEAASLGEEAGLFELLTLPPPGDP